MDQIGDELADFIEIWQFVLAASYGVWIVHVAPGAPRPGWLTLAVATGILAAVAFGVRLAALGWTLCWDIFHPRYGMRTVLIIFGIVLVPSVDRLAARFLPRAWMRHFAIFVYIIGMAWCSSGFRRLW